jgi:hypothetical protein
VKKKRGGLRLLSRVEVSELRLWWTADPPRPFQLRPVPRFSASGSGRGTSTPALFLDVFRSSDSTGLRPFRRRLPELALLLPVGSSGLRLPNTGPSAAEAASGPNLPEPKLFLIPIFRCRSFFRSFDLHQPKLFPVCDLVRLAPPGVYLKGSRLPFESPFNGTTGFLQSPVRATCSVPCEHLSVVRCPPLCLPAGRPSGWRDSSNGGFKLLLWVGVVNDVRGEVMSDRSRSISRENCKLLNIKNTWVFQKFFFCDEANELLKNRSEQKWDRYYYSVHEQKNSLFGGCASSCSLW